MTLLKWARALTDRKAARRQRSALAELSDHQLFQFLREAAALRDASYAQSVARLPIG